MTRFNFRKQESNRYVRVSKSYRRPRGFHSKMREHRKGNLRLPEAGFGSPVETRGFHPCGLQEMLVFNESMIASVNPKLYAIRISANVAHPRKMKIAEAAKKLGLKVLNPPKAREKKKEAAKKAETAKAEKAKNPEAKPKTPVTPKEMMTKVPIKEHRTPAPAKQKNAAGVVLGGAEK